MLSCASKPEPRSGATEGSSSGGSSSSTGPVAGAPDVGDERDGTTPTSSSSAESSSGTELPAVVVHGHRGDRGNVPPGNTLPSFGSALQYGVDVLEGDLQITAEGSVVLGHDNDLRTTPCAWAGRGSSSSALVSNMADAELAQWDCHPELDGIQAPPHLHEVIALSDSVGFNLELKQWGTEAADVYLPALIAQDEACGGCLAPRLIVQSFDWIGLEHVHTTYAATFEVRLSLLAQAPRPEELSAAARWAQIWSPNQDLATASAIEEAHAMGLAVAPWTVNDEADMQRLIDAGADAIITDVPDVLLGLLGR
ncbi:MAG: hypothetical protein KUG77_19670 [Nannocystaceae bacterium]|nr:hypothetical protein [Nannocystaceae bacterium]